MSEPPKLLRDELVRLATGPPPEGVELGAHLDALRERITEMIGCPAPLTLQQLDLWAPPETQHGPSAFIGAFRQVSTHTYDAPPAGWAAPTSTPAEDVARTAEELKAILDRGPLCVPARPIQTPRCEGAVMTHAPVPAYADGEKAGAARERTRFLELLEEAADGAGPDARGRLDWVRDMLGAKEVAPEKGGAPREGGRP